MGRLLCNAMIYYASAPWFAFGPETPEPDLRPIVTRVFPRHNATNASRPFRVRIGETVYLRDDGSVSLPFVKRNRILFPDTCPADVGRVCAECSNPFSCMTHVRGRANRHIFEADFNLYPATHTPVAMATASSSPAGEMGEVGEASEEDADWVRVDRATALASAFSDMQPDAQAVEGADDTGRRTRIRRPDAFQGLAGPCGGCGDCGACRECNDDDEAEVEGFEQVTGDSYHEEYTIETVARDPLDYLAGLLDDHCALVQRRAAAKRIALNMTVCTQQVQAAEEEAAREAVRWTRLEEDTFLGDVRLRTVRQLLHEIDERGTLRTRTCATIDSTSPTFQLV